MNNQEEIGEKAVTHFRSGFNCAESVLMTIQEALGIKSSVIPEIATGFGGGIARQGSVCGAVSGAVMVIGLKYGRMKPQGDKERAYALVLEFCRKFEKKFGSILCYDLTECGLTTTEGRRKFDDLNIAEEKCVHFVREAVNILWDLIMR
jgi:C_GCAxxG_C_C family probable redox protein